MPLKKVNFVKLKRKGSLVIANGTTRNFKSYTELGDSILSFASQKCVIATSLWQVYLIHHLGQVLTKSCWAAGSQADSGNVTVAQAAALARDSKPGAWGLRVTGPAGTHDDCHSQWQCLTE